MPLGVCSEPWSVSAAGRQRLCSPATATAGLAHRKGDTPTVLQSFVMDDDGANVTMIGHLNIKHRLASHQSQRMAGSCCTSYESQGLRPSAAMGSAGTVHPDGTPWAPLAILPLGLSGDTAYHFMTQLSDESIVVEEYYNLNNHGLRHLLQTCLHGPRIQAFFGPASTKDPRNLAYNVTSHNRMPSALSLEWLTPFCTAFGARARLSDPGKDPEFAARSAR